MSVFEGYHDRFNEEVRLIILKGLRDEESGRMSDSMLMFVLEAFAVTRSKEYLRTQLAWMEREAGAVKLHVAGTAVIAELTQAGENHLERRGQIEGIKPPSRVRG